MKTKYTATHEGKEYSINTERAISHVVLSGPRPVYNRKTERSDVTMQANWYDCIEKAEKKAQEELKHGWEKAIVIKI